MPDAWGTDTAGTVPSAHIRPASIGSHSLAGKCGCARLDRFGSRRANPCPFFYRVRPRKNVPEISSPNAPSVLSVNGSWLSPTSPSLSTFYSVEIHTVTFASLSRPRPQGIQSPCASLVQAAGYPGLGVGDERIFPECLPYGFNEAAVVTITRPNERLQNDGV